MIQQEVLTQIFENDNKTESVFTISPRPISSYRQSEIEMIEEENAPPEAKELYHDIKTTELRNLKRMIKMFTELLSGLIVNDALSHIGIAAGQTIVQPRPG